MTFGVVLITFGVRLWGLADCHQAGCTSSSLESAHGLPMSSGWLYVVQFGVGSWAANVQ